MVIPVKGSIKSIYDVNVLHFLSSVTRVPVQPPPGIVELDGEKFTLQW